MRDKPLKEINAGEILEDLSLFNSALKKTEKKQLIIQDDQELNREIEKVISSLGSAPWPYWDPERNFREAYFAELGEVAGTHSGFGYFALNKKFLSNWRGDLDLPSVICHELTHTLGYSWFGEIITTLLGWEICAKMALAKNKCYEASLWYNFKNAALYAGFYQAEKNGELRDWKIKVKKYQKDIEKQIQYWRKMEKQCLFQKFSDYNKTPYLVVKNGLGDKTILVESEQIEIPAIAQCVKKLRYREEENDNRSIGRNSGFFKRY